MRSFLLKTVVFAVFTVVIVSLSQQTQNLKIEKTVVTVNLEQALEQARNQLFLVLGDDSTLKSQIRNLNLDPSGCGGKDQDLLPDFLFQKETSTVEVCQMRLLKEHPNFQDRVVFEFFSAHGLCDTATDEAVEQLCAQRDGNELYQVDRFLASARQQPDANVFTLNVDYGDKSSVFVVVEGAQTKLAYKTNYGDQSLVALEPEDFIYLKSQVEKIERKFSKPKCRRKVIRLFAKSESGQRFRSFACIEKANVQTQRLLKLTRTVTSLSKNTL